MNIKILIICLLLCGCASETVKKDVSKPQNYYRDWCITCGNKGWISCDTCWDGKTQSGLKCWKCNGMGKLHCPTCFGKSNPNGEWK